MSWAGTRNAGLCGYKGKTFTDFTEKYFISVDLKKLLLTVSMLHVKANTPRKFLLFYIFPSRNYFYRILALYVTIVTIELLCFSDI